MKFILYLLLLPIFCVAQCDGNLLLNGDFESDSIGSRVTGAHWIERGNPDLNGLLSSNPNGPNPSWNWNGDLIAPSIGVQWQNITATETITQVVNTVIGKRYLLSLEYANQQITSEQSGNNTSDAGNVTININGIPSYESARTQDLFVWNFLCHSFIAEADSISITIGTSGAYLGIDNICLVEDSTFIVLEDEFNFCLNEELLIENKGLDVFDLLWSDGSSDNSFSISQSGQYWVDISDECGTYREEFEVVLEDCGCKLYIPDTFNPNMGGINGSFALGSNCDLQKYELLIYDRWGSPVFSSIDIFTSWDGKVGLEKAASGVYLYQLKYSFLDNERECYGAINLVR